MPSKSEEGLIDKVVGRFKKAAGDLKDDPQLRAEGATEENRGKAKEELEEAEKRVEEKAQDVANRS